MGYNSEYQEENGIIYIKTSVNHAKPDDNSPIIKRIEELGVLDYCTAGDWIYYITLAEEEGFHQMSADGTEDTVIYNLFKIEHLDGSTSVSSQYNSNSIIYKFQQLRQYDKDRELGAPSPVYFYRLDLSDHTLTALPAR